VIDGWRGLAAARLACVDGGPITNADSENITANTARPIAGAHQEA